MRRTKIVATIGPASWDPDTLDAMIAAGMNVARIGMAHGSLEQHIDTYYRIRAAAERARADIGILVDLPGPKIRCASFPEGGVDLHEGSEIRIVHGTTASNAEVIEVEIEEVVRDIAVGDRMALGDGALVMIAEKTDGSEIVARVIHGGIAKGRPGFGVPSNRISLGSPTREDLRLVDAFVEEGVDMIAVSFVRSAHDIRAVGVERPPKGPMLIAKIETQAAVENLEGIVETAGAVMVARGDLGIDYPLSELPHLQKLIIRRCVARGRPVITATQMLESMVYSPMPTRAEASDVANAVFDGSSAVMLSGESAVGIDPVNAVATMAEICARADQEFDHQAWSRSIRSQRDGDAYADPTVISTDALTAAAWDVARQVDAKGIICLSRTGFTARKVTRWRPNVPIYAFSPDPRTVNQLTLSWGTTPFKTEERTSAEELVREALTITREAHDLQTGDTVIVISGQSTRSRETDTLRIMRIP